VISARVGPRDVRASAATGGMGGGAVVSGEGMVGFRESGRE